MKHKLFYIASFLLFFSNMTSAETRHQDCRLKSIDFDIFPNGQMLYLCQGEELRLDRTRPMIEQVIRENLVANHWEAEPRGEIQVSTSTTGLPIFDGFLVYSEVRELARARFNRDNLTIEDFLNHKIIKLTQEMIDKAPVVDKFLPDRDWFMGDRVVVQKIKRGLRRDWIVVRENCWPKNCGQTTFINLR